MDGKNRLKMLINKLWKTHKIGIPAGFQEHNGRFFNLIPGMTNLLIFLYPQLFVNEGHFLWKSGCFEDRRTCIL
jgi:hypothetical protein